MLALPQGAALPPRAVVEDTLTNGYAHALRLDAERLRLERRLRDAVQERSADDAAELRALLDRAEGELARVRGLLSSLRSHALR